MDVLLVEDNPADADLTRETLTLSGLDVNLDVAIDGIDALDRLLRLRDSGAALPDLILLDLNLPKRNGREILLDLKASPSFRHIPIVVLTSSESEIDIIESYRLGASCYVSKPVDFKAFRAIIEAIVQFWFTVVRLPYAAS